MSFVGSLSSGGIGSVGRFAGITRGRIQGSPTNGVNYPSPFFDVAHTYLPVTVKQLFKWCRYYFLTNPLVNATVFKMSEYPVTDIIIEHEDSKVRKRWEEYYHDHLRFRSFQIECGLDYYTYGTAPISLGFPFKKFLTCPVCKFQARADKIRKQWTFTSLAFRLNCPACGQTSEAEARDVYYKNASGIVPLRWNVENIEINYNEVTGDTTHFYTIPPVIRNDITIGKKDVVESVPQVFIQAIRQRKGIVFSKDNFFAMKRPTLAQQDRGWGTPLVLPVLKDTFYLQIMKKAQEAILLEHIIPLRVLFPQAGSGTSDPYCVSPDTLVETRSGLVRADEVQAGDYLRSHTGVWREVEYRKDRIVKQDEKVYSVKVASLPAFPFTVSEEHPILAIKANGRKCRTEFGAPEFIPVQELNVGDYVAYPAKQEIINTEYLDLNKYVNRTVTKQWMYLRLNQDDANIYEWMKSTNPEPLQYGGKKKLLKENGWSDSSYENARAASKQETIARVPRYLPVTTDLARLIGYYMAEGHYAGSMANFTLHLKEKYIADDIEAIVKSMGFNGVCHYERPVQNSRTARINDVILSEFLFNLCGPEFGGKRVPEFISNGPDDIVRAFLHGLYEGDGCDFSTKTNRVGLKLANASVVLEVRRLLLRFGLVGGITKEDPTPTSKHRHTAYALNFNGSMADYARKVLSCEPLDSEPPPSKECVFSGDYLLMPIRSIETTNEVPMVIGFQMEEDKSFCVAGVATHNTTINLNEWREQVASEIARWRYDNNYIPILPLPIGHQAIGGDGRALLLTQEIQIWSEQIMVGMGVPKEFLLGGMSYSGTNVSMRMLENAFLGYIQRQKEMANWFMQRVAAYMGWPRATVKFKPFKMADDMQRKAYLFQLNQAQKISDTTLLHDSDLNQEDEDALMVAETASRQESTKKQQLAMAKIQGEAQEIMMKAQVKAQQIQQAAMAAPNAPGEPGGPEGAMPSSGIPQEAQSPLNAGQDAGMAPQEGQQPQQGVDINQLAMMLAEQLVELPPDQQQMALQNLQAQSPELAELVQQYARQSQGNQPQGMGGALGASVSQVDTRPQPEQKPARRMAASV